MRTAWAATSAAVSPTCASSSYAPPAGSIPPRIRGSTSAPPRRRRAEACTGSAAPSPPAAPCAGPPGACDRRPRKTPHAVTLAGLYPLQSKSMRPVDRWLGPLYRLYAWRLWSLIHRGPVPRHLALILDGNRRFVERTNLGSLRDGYRAGAKRADVVLDWCQRAGIHAVTLWVMSLDNLTRQEE